LGVLRKKRGGGSTTAETKGESVEGLEVITKLVVEEACREENWYAKGSIYWSTLRGPRSVNLPLLVHSHHLLWRQGDSPQ